MTTQHDIQYLDLVEDVLASGTKKGDRTGTGTISVFGRQMRFDLSDGTIPLLTTKKMHLRSIIHEILWYLSGSSNVKYLQDNGVRIWNEWADENGDLGPVYGVQWRKWEAFESATIDWSTEKPVVDVKFKQIDQIGNLIHKLKTNPDDRRLIVNAWNVGELENMKLPPCHYAFQFYVANGKLSCMLNQRSCDVGLGVPFNIAQYSIITRMIAHVVGLEPGEFIWSGGDVHIYTNHVDALAEQLGRTPYESPTLSFARDIDCIDDFKFDDFELNDYQSHDTIKMTVSV